MKENPHRKKPNATDPSINAVIQASAGTGKTWLLTGRILRLLLGGTLPGSILAITFTRKAAADMQLRLRQRLLAMSNANDEVLRQALTEIGAPYDGDALTRARQLYEELLASPHDLRITTFHAFCQEILARFPMEAGTAPQFTLVEQTGELETEAWRRLDEDLARPSEALEKAVRTLFEECGGLANTRRALQTFLEHRSDWWAYTEEHSHAVKFAEQRLRQTLNINPDIRPLEAFASDTDFRTALHEYIRSFNGKSFGKVHISLALLGEALASETTPTVFFQLIRDAFLRADGLPRAFTPTKGFTQEVGAETVQRLIEQHNRLLDRLHAAIERQRQYKTWVRTSAWYLVGQRLLDHYQTFKHEQEALDFSDLEWLTYRLLNRSRHAEWVQYKLDQRIDHLLVDEFQDTNPTQWRLLLPLLQEISAGASERARSLFIVGDQKQSIYRFRRADAGLLPLARDWLCAHSNAIVFDQYVSWRSSPAVVQFVNLVFSNISASDIDAAFALEGFHEHETHLRDLWGHVEVLPLVARRTEESVALAFRNPLHTARVAEEDQRHRQEGEQIAQKIQSLIGQPIHDHGQVRNLRYGDIVILLRDRTHAAAYEAVLRDAHIPYVGTGRGNFLDCLEVRDIVQLLTFLITPLDDLALASILRSPMFSATDDDLLSLADSDEGPWLERLLHHSATPTTPLARAARLLPSWRQLADKIPVHDLLDRIYYDTNLPERYRAGAPRHLQQRVLANLTRLLELALELDGGRFPSIARFLSQLEALTQDDNEFQGGSTTLNQVRVLTIHAAKGLESPVVFLADAARAISRDRGVRALIEWPLQQQHPSLCVLVGTKSDTDALTRAAIDRQEAAAQREEANLLYVALTRARQHLFISGCEPGVRAGNKAGDASRGWYGFIERRLQAATPAPTVELRTISLPDSEQIYNAYGTLTFGETPALPATSTTQKTATRAPLDPQLLRPFAKRSPTGGIIRPSTAVLDDTDELPELFAETVTSPSTAKQRGIVIHRMLEKLAPKSAEREHVRQQLWKEFAGTMEKDLLNGCWIEACAVVDAPQHQVYFDSNLFVEARNEVTVLYDADNRQVTGVIDRVVIRDDDLILIDYKTNRATVDKLPGLAASYMSQLKLYAEGLRRLWPTKRINAVLLFTDPCQAMTVNLD